MTLPLPFPDWMPPWAQLILVVAGLLAGLAFLAMPFSVFGIKGRLDAIENRLDEMQGDLRKLAQRLPDVPLGPYDPPAVLRVAAAAASRAPAPLPPAPIPPASWVAEPAPVARELRSPTLRAAARLGEAARERAEPRLDRRP